jgi:RNA polymerase sigma-B factor
LSLDVSQTRDTARRRLIDSHLPLVRSVARRYAGRGEELDDLVQVGALGLVKASERFDPSRGVAFATFVTPAIEGEIRRHLGERTHALRIPRDVQSMSRKLHQRQGELAAQLGRFPTTEELAGALDTDVPAVENALAAVRASDPVAVASGDEPIEQSDATEPLAESDNRMLVAASLRVLDERERQIVFLRFHADMTERQIAQAVGISQAHVSRQLDAALAKLRTELARANEPAGSGDTNETPVVSPPQDGPQSRTDAPAGGSRIRKPTVRDSSHSTIATVGTESESQSTRTSKSKAAPTYSGRFLVRMPSELHEQLARAAEREDLSLNRFVTEALATSVGLEPDAEHADPATAEHTDATATEEQLPIRHTEEPELEREHRPSRERQGHPPTVGALRLALATNLIVVVLAGFVAVILLVLALQRGI